MTPSILAVVQARMGSIRLPQKVMREINGTPMIGLLLQRLADSERISRIVVATPESAENDSLVAYVEGLGFATVRGDENDVLARYASALEQHDPDVVVRITGDCPLVDATLVDRAIDAFAQQGVSYLSNVDPPTFPDGLDIEVMSASALREAVHHASSAYDREHVTPYLRTSGDFTTGTFTANADHSDLRWTVDDADDLAFVQSVFTHFAPRTTFGWQEILAFAETASALRSGGSPTRNEGASMNSGQKLWQRARRVIPGGNMLLSKRPEMFLPDAWPAYFASSAGCTVTDLDGKTYIDMSLMGIGTNTLGYGHPDVDEAVRTTVAAGNMSTLNCPEEVYLAERLVAMHPWADMARLARSGGEANAIAIRIARAASGRDGVAICGYHGWHDWYLAANLGDDESLDGHLLPGLEANGVPRDLRGSVFPFTYNDDARLEELIAAQSIGVIKMEVSRNFAPDTAFLKRVRELATANGIVLIFDECTSGFRETFGGLHLKYGVDPDMTVLGKTLGNGYAITAVLGRESVMDAAQTTFISSTFWTERIGPTAALATLDAMEACASWDTITATGSDITERWKQLAAKHGFEITTAGLAALTSFAVPGANALAYKTLITQEMLKRGYLASTAVYSCTAHTPESVDAYFAELDPIFGTIAECESGRDVHALLDGPICHSGFARLN
jgi:glutamate-1-semialdehyde 2,1-aminomutase